MCSGACEGAGWERCMRLAEGAREPGEIESTETTREIERCVGGIQGNIEKKRKRKWKKIKEKRWKKRKERKITRCMQQNDYKD